MKCKNKFLYSCIIVYTRLVAILYSCLIVFFQFFVDRINQSIPTAFIFYTPLNLTNWRKQQHTNSLYF